MRFVDDNGGGNDPPRGGVRTRGSVGEVFRWYSVSNQEMLSVNPNEHGGMKPE